MTVCQRLMSYYRVCHGCPIGTGLNPLLSLLSFVHVIIGCIRLSRWAVSFYLAFLILLVHFFKTQNFILSWLEM